MRASEHTKKLCAPVRKQKAIPKQPAIHHPTRRIRSIPVRVGVSWTLQAHWHLPSFAPKATKSLSCHRALNLPFTFLIGQLRFVSKPCLYVPLVRTAWTIGKMSSPFTLGPVLCHNPVLSNTTKVFRLDLDTAPLMSSQGSDMILRSFQAETRHLCVVCTTVVRLL